MSCGIRKWFYLGLSLNPYVIEILIEMKTESYNPSKLEVELANVLIKIKNEIESGLSDNTVESISANIKLDNPQVHIKTRDSDGDPHEIVLRIIQRPDTH